MRYRWPNGAQCTVALSFDVDAESGYVYRNPKEAASQLDQMEERTEEAVAGAWLGGRIFRDTAGDTWQEIDIKALLALPEFMKIALS